MRVAVLYFLLGVFMPFSACAIGAGGELSERNHSAAMCGESKVIGVVNNKATITQQLTRFRNWAWGMRRGVIGAASVAGAYVLYGLVQKKQRDNNNGFCGSVFRD